MKTVFQKLNFRILSMRARVRVIITGKLLRRRFSEIKFQKVNEILEISKNIYLRKFPAIWYIIHAPYICTYMYL